MQQLTVDGAILAVLLFQLERTAAGTGPSAELLGFQKRRATPASRPPSQSFPSPPLAHSMPASACHSPAAGFLADAVREESGGLDLGTLFVDEGFGSLDEDSLEQVLGVLDGLREGGRAVGVVSHVADLRTRIPHQAVVRKTATGSTVVVRSAGDDAVPAA